MRAPKFVTRRSRLRDVAAAALEQGWVIESTAGGHLKWTPPNGKFPVFTPATSSDWRGRKNALSDLRKRGLDTKGLR